MSTNDVPGYGAAKQDVLALGVWAEHEDGSLIFVEGVEAGTVVCSMFDVAMDPPVEYRMAMPEVGFKERFSWQPDDGKSKDKWSWHNRQPMPWQRVMRDFPAGARLVSADDTMTAARRVAESLDLRAGAVNERAELNPTMAAGANKMMEGFLEVLQSLKP